jgi:hypothetical protein
MYVRHAHVELKVLPKVNVVKPHLSRPGDGLVTEVSEALVQRDHIDKELTTVGIESDGRLQ